VKTATGRVGKKLEKSVIGRVMLWKQFRLEELVITDYRRLEISAHVIKRWGDGDGKERTRNSVISPLEKYH
jgi:hypothetical protein